MDQNHQLFEESALSALKEYVWPGNIRELKNLIERAAIIFGEKKLMVKISERIYSKLIYQTLKKKKIHYGL